MEPHLLAAPTSLLGDVGADGSLHVAISKYPAGQSLWNDEALVDGLSFRVPVSKIVC